MSDLLAITSSMGGVFLLRIMIPGLVLALLLLPVINPLVPQMLMIDELADLAIILLPEGLLLGIFVSLLRNLIYRIYEGRLLWPQWLHRTLTRRMNRRVRKRLDRAEKLDASSVEYKELWYWLRLFPLDSEGNPIARRPTILGNLLEGYEEYPLRRYGMDSIFYWYRLWPTLPEGFIKQMDQFAAEADCLIYISLSGLVVGLFHAILAIVKWIIVSLINRWIAIPASILAFLDLIPGWGFPIVWVVGCLVGGFVVYSISLPLHRRHGEFFKAAFDLYRDNITEITKASAEEKAKWLKAWSYLQYMYVQCPHCQRYYYAEAEKCLYCGKPQKPQVEIDTTEESPLSVRMGSFLYRFLALLRR
jgi:hypothetical protein